MASNTTFRVVVSSYFADIFRGNALNTGLLPLQVTDAELSRLFALVEQDAQTQFVVDLPAQTLYVPATNETFGFGIDPYKKECLINGYDDIDFLVNQKPAIAAYEQSRIWSW